LRILLFNPGRLLQGSEASLLKDWEVEAPAANDRVKDHLSPPTYQAQSRSIAKHLCRAQHAVCPYGKNLRLGTVRAGERVKRAGETPALRKPVRFSPCPDEPFRVTVLLL
jgi:hypothetical protein